MAKIQNIINAVIFIIYLVTVKVFDRADFVLVAQAVLLLLLTAELFRKKELTIKIVGIQALNVVIQGIIMFILSLFGISVVMSSSIFMVGGLELIMYFGIHIAFVNFLILCWIIKWIIKWTIKYIFYF